MDKNFLITCLALSLIPLIGIIFLCIGIGFNKNRKKKIENCTAVAKGKVVNIVKKYNDTGDVDRASTYMFHPVIEYNVNGEKYTKTSNFGATPSKYKIGDEVEICYNPENPDKYYIKEDNTQKILGIVFTTVGIIILVVSILVALLLALKQII